MNPYNNLRAVASGQIRTTGVYLVELRELLAEVEAFRAAAPAKKVRAKKAAPEVETLPDWMPLEAWAAFLSMRVKIKKPATDYAQKLLVKKLAAFYANDLDPGVILNQSILNGWQDLYAPKEQSTAHLGQFAGRPLVADVNRANNAAALALLDQANFDMARTIDACE